ncbi:MAG: hypothetical protein SFU25_02600 [Candidatus Caenarcaniphilales bacterium]|nr:hypothetical protein [Candidatus Caenarcaniphilales bacterium]
MKIPVLVSSVIVLVILWCFFSSSFYPNTIIISPGETKKIGRLGVTFKEAKVEDVYDGIRKVTISYQLHNTRKRRKSIAFLWSRSNYALKVRPRLSFIKDENGKKFYPEKINILNFDGPLKWFYIYRDKTKEATAEFVLPPEAGKNLRYFYNLNKPAFTRIIFVVP